MENRFGVKDFFLLVMMAALVVVIVLAMKQYDRQLGVLLSMDEQLRTQTRELSQLRRMLSTGAVSSTAVGPTTRPVAGGEWKDPFFRVREIQKRPDYAMGDWLVDNFGVKVGKLTPYVSTDIYASVVQARVQEGLAYRDAVTLEWVPLLAQSWQMSADGLAYTFQLRRGVTFSDGEPFTAEDVIFTYNFLMNPKVAAPRARAYFDKIASVEKKGDYEVVFRMKEPYFGSFGVIADDLQIMPKHFYGKYAGREQEFNDSTGLLMGTGPYMLKDPAQWRPGDRIELVRNERYWGEPGTFDRLLWYEVEQESAEMTMFKNGELDRFAAQPEQYREMLKDPAVLARNNRFEYVSPVGGYTFVAWNEKINNVPTRFADKRVRTAMTMLVDRQRMAEVLFLGYAKPAVGPFFSEGKQRDPSVQAVPYDPSRARALLKEAGFEDRNGDGVLESADGKPFRFKLTYGTGNQLSEKIALFLKDALAKGGVVMEPDPTDWPIMLKRMDNRDFDAITLGWSASIESDIFQMFHSSQIKDNGDNFMSYANPALDSALEKARRTIDEGERMKLWHEVHRIIAEDQPYTFLLEQVALVFVDKRIKNVERAPLGLNYFQRFVMPIVWYVPKELQKRSR